MTRQRPLETSCGSATEFLNTALSKCQNLESPFALASPVPHFHCIRGLRLCVGRYPVLRRRLFDFNTAVFVAGRRDSTHVTQLHWTRGRRDITPYQHRLVPAATPSLMGIYRPDWREVQTAGGLQLPLWPTNCCCARHSTCSTTISSVSKLLDTFCLSRTRRICRCLRGQRTIHRHYTSYSIALSQQLG